MRPCRHLLVALAGLPAALGLAAPASADTIPSPPFIDRAQWQHWGDLVSLRVYPTAAGREAAGRLFKPPWEADEAWSEVLAMAPDAGTPGMREQFVCHFRFAEFAEPGKASWNLEPWRPVVDENTMTAAGCNPGGSEEPF